MLVAEPEASVLRGDEALFHRVGHAHADREADDARCAFERVGRAHTQFELFRRDGIALQGQESGGHCLRLRLRLQAEQGEHGDLAEIRGVHARLRCSV